MNEPNADGGHPRRRFAIVQGSQADHPCRDAPSVYAQDLG